MGLLPEAEGEDGGSKLLGCLKRTAFSSFRCCLGGLALGRSPPEPSAEVLDLMVSLQMTNLHLHQLHRKFLQLKQFDPITVHVGPNEVSINSISRMVRRHRDWTSLILKNILELGGYFDIVPWDGFLYVLISFCTLSKLELCQVMFFVVIKEVRSWTVHTLTCAQLQEFFEFYKYCPIQSFNTGMLHFDTLPLSRYSMMDFIELVHGFPQLIGPCLHLQRSLQQVLPSFSFWEDYDRVKVQNRKITIDFFVVRKCRDLYAAAVEAVTADVVTDDRPDGHVRDPAQAALNIMRDLESKKAERYGGKADLKDSMANRHCLPLPSSELPPRRERSEEETKPIKAWMQDLVKENQDPVTGHALGSAALPPSALLAERQGRAAWYADQVKQVTKTIDQASALINRTKGPRRPMEQYEARKKQEQIEKLSEEAAEKLQAMDRATQLELIRRSRLAAQKHGSIVEVMDRTTQCELINRSNARAGRRRRRM